MFWAAFILTRPLGATVGDWFDKPVAKGGLDMSRPVASAVLAVVILVLIMVLPQRAGSHPGAAERARVKLFRAAVSLAFVVTPLPSFAGPPYLTDDPAPTDMGHWEIYAFTAGEGHGSSLDEDLGFDLNYGPVKDVQLTATVPLSLSHEPLDGWRGGSGDLELGVKYRFIKNESAGVSAAVFPRVILPTAAHSPGEKTRVLLPLWVQKDFKGGTSLFGGGGYELNPGTGNHNFWQAGIALTTGHQQEGIPGS